MGRKGLLVGAPTSLAAAPLLGRPPRAGETNYRQCVMPLRRTELMERR
jgi:hypothetical protein